MTTQPFDIDTIIFDFGNVVVQWSIAALLDEFFDDTADLDDFLSNVLTHEQNLRADLGMPLDQLVAELTEQHPHHRAPLEAWRDRWIETLPAMVDGTEALIDELRAANYRLLGLSNFNADTFAIARERYPIFDTFDGIVLSGVEGTAKPDRAIYERLIKRFDLTPSRCVFMDDSPANVAAAQFVGLNAFVFSDCASARRILRNEFGVLTSAQRTA